MNTVIKTWAQRSACRFKRSKVCVAFALMAAAIPNLGWAQEYACEVVAPPEVEMDGLLQGTIDPRNYANGEKIGEIRAMIVKRGQYKCSGSAPVGRLGGRMTLTVGGGYLTLKDGMWTGTITNVRGYGFRFFGRAPDGSVKIGTTSSGASLRENFADPNADSRVFYGSALGLLGRIEIYKLDDTAGDLSLVGPPGSSTNFELSEVVGHMYDNSDQCYTGGKCTVSSWNAPSSIVYKAVEKPSCKIANPNIRLDGVRVAAPNPLNPVLPTRGFSIDMDCSGGAVDELVSVSFSMYDDFNQGGTSDQLSLSPASTAKGIAIEIERSNGSKVTFNKEGAHPWLEGHLPAGTHRIPFTMKVVKKAGEAIRYGDFEARAVYEMTYL